MKPVELGRKIAQSISKLPTKSSGRGLFHGLVCRRLLDPVLGLRLGRRLPLHVLRLVDDAALLRNDVAHDVRRAGTGLFPGCRAGALPLELPPGPPARA